MRWPWQRCNRETSNVQVPPIPEPATSIEEARAARQKAEADLRQARAQWGPIRAVTASFRDHKDGGDHFAERLGSAFRE